MTDARDGDGSDADAPNGDAADADPPDGDAADADRPDREPADADTPDGDAAANVPNSDAADAATTADDADTTADDESTSGAAASDETDDLESLREQVEEKYDFENFGPADMAEMSVEEWQAAFDPDTWITGAELLDRLEADLRTRIADREVFARLERHAEPPRLVAYSDEGYAVVYPDGSVTGEGTVLRDVKPSVALCSMESYDVPEPPEDAGLPTPEEVPEQSGELGNLMLQAIAGIQVLAAVVLLGAGVVAFGTRGQNALLLFAAGIGFLIIGILLFVTVANARLSDAFRAEEYRNRLRAVGTEDGARPSFLPPEAGGESGEGRSSLEGSRPEETDADDADG